MARRKKRKFGSPPAEHKKRVVIYAKSARVKANALRRSLARGDCRAATNQLVGLGEAIGKASSELKGYAAKRRSNKFLALQGIIVSVQNRFIAQCVKPRR